MTSPLPREHRPAGGTEPPPQTPPRRADPWAIVMGIMGGVLLGTGLTFAILGYVGIFEEPTPPTIPPAPTLTVPPPTSPAPTFGETASAAAVAALVAPSTVAVEIDSFLLSGSGSGVVYGPDGYIITNHHVIDGAGSVAVVFPDGGRFQAQVVGSDPVTDIGVLLVNRTDLTPITLGSADALAIGDAAVAVGNPLGLVGGPTVTSGIVSALDRSLQVNPGTDLYGLVQTDAPIAPGSSGGALVDAAGRLVGITTAVAVSDVGLADLGFAVPIEIAIGVVDDLIETGAVQHALMGIQGETAWAREDQAEFPVGILVDGITSDSAYEAAGGRVNDVIVEIDGFPVNTFDTLLARLRRMRAGDVVPIRILRSDANTTLDVTMGLLEP
ncbi:MAG TPA: trypsin-like peptidase domain-containing protein [Acidimicrobiia bacterium]|nr:trypsin-like peptidase domain-containing protein [Acidimicrobiia bacterium]